MPPQVAAKALEEAKLRKEQQEVFNETFTKGEIGPPKIIFLRNHPPGARLSALGSRPLAPATADPRMHSFRCRTMAEDSSLTLSLHVYDVTADALRGALISNLRSVKKKEAEQQAATAGTEIKFGWPSWGNRKPVSHSSLPRPNPTASPSPLAPNCAICTPHHLRARARMPLNHRPQRGLRSDSRLRILNSSGRIGSGGSLEVYSRFIRCLLEGPS